MNSSFKILLGAGAAAVVLGLGATGPASAFSGAIVPDAPERMVIDPNDRSIVDPNIRSVVDPND